MVQERPVVRVTTAEGNHINVRKDELERYMAAHPGAVVDGSEEPAVEGAEDADAPRRGRATAKTDEPADDKGAA